MTYCSHCIDPTQVAVLLATPLREIDAQLMGHYRWNATAETWGDWDDFKHFLPRLLELVSTGELADYSPDMLFSSIGYQSHYWPDNERAAVRVYLDALINASAPSFADEIAEALSIFDAVPEVAQPTQYSGHRQASCDGARGSLTVTDKSSMG
jgi:hypothetical protein